MRGTLFTRDVAAREKFFAIFAHLRMQECSKSISAFFQDTVAANLNATSAFSGLSTLG